MTRFALILPLALLTACSEDALLTPGQCYVDEPLPGIIVEVVDKSSGAALADGARGAAHDGAFVDSLVQRSATSLGSRNSRPGTYTVEVVHDGYVPWMAAGIRVMAYSCTFEPAMLRAELVASP